MKAKNDRRSERTRQALHDALFDLMMEQGYDAITIKDIVERANVGRSTFYAHYANKDDLFVNQLDRLFEMLSQPVSQETSDENPFFPGLGLFRHVQEQWKLYKILSWEPGFDLHIRRLQEAISGKIEQRLFASGQRFDVPVPIIASFLAGSLLSVLKWWLDNKMAYSPAEMDEMFRKLALPGIAQTAKSEINPERKSL
jgi:AcrR family transcriptional regulator